MARGEIPAGPVDTWPPWNLTGGEVFATDVTNASRTQLMSLETMSWDPRLLALLDIPAETPPEIRSSSAHRGLPRRAPGRHLGRASLRPHFDPGPDWRESRRWQTSWPADRRDQGHTRWKAAVERTFGLGDI
ncbi:MULTISPECIES: FGGY family carbohydrate kinase [Catenuloplanes]|uniref:Glycerol kinase n=1 Tax=Catenuloplanes niger TaxID=587534 RepID=A0AAE4CUZ3_9ACTN|nr:glycerol kinase [Catenuloplanes niger]